MRPGGFPEGPEGRLAARARALHRVLSELRATPGLIESERLGLQVAGEVLGEALRDLGRLGTLTDVQRQALLDAGARLDAAADQLENPPDANAIAAWLGTIDPAIRAFASTVRSPRSR